MSEGPEDPPGRGDADAGDDAEADDHPDPAPEGGADPGGTDPEDRDDREAPLSGLADRVRRSRSERARSGDSLADLAATDADEADPGSDPFEAMEVDTVDEESVWESLESEDPEVTDQPAVGSGGDAERVDPADARGDRPEHVVRKTAYCQRCRFFSDPPAVRCSHEGTAIVEVVDSERFRVRDCPMVAYGGTGATERD